MLFRIINYERKGEYSRDMITCFSAQFKFPETRIAMIVSYFFLLAESTAYITAPSIVGG